MSSPVRAPSRLRWNFLWMLIGNGVYAACLWGILVVLTKIATAQDVGKFNLGLAITSPVAMLLNLNLRALQATDARHDFSFSVYFSLRLLCALVALAVCVAIALVFDYPLDTRLVIVAIALARAFQSQSDVVHGLFQKHEQMARLAGHRMAQGLGYVLAVSAIMAWTGNIVEGATAFAATALLGLLVLDLPRARRIEPLGVRAAPHALWDLFHTALPVGLVMMLINLAGNIPIYFIDFHEGERSVGHYAALNYVGVAGTTLVGALAQAAAPRLAIFHVSNRPGPFRRLLHRLVGVGAVIGGVGVLAALVAGEQILGLLYSPEYAAHARVFSILMVGYGFSYASLFVGVALTAKRELRLLLIVNAITIAINVGLCWMLVPEMGLSGGAWAMTGSLLFKFCANYLVAFTR